MNKISVVVLLAAVTLGAAGAAETQPAGIADAPSVGQYATRGTVLDVIDSSLYTYLQVSSEKGEVWLAAFRNDIAKGETVSYTKGILKMNFHSETLNRTFDKIIFVDAVMPVRK